jgi:hypothetical protein
MNIIDLELYRWSLVMLIDHSSAYKTYPGTSPWWRIYWQEYGAFVCTLPRRSGKTTMLKKMADHFRKNGEEYAIFIPRLGMASSMVQMGFDIHKIHSGIARGLEYNKINLLVDEYQEFSSAHVSDELKNALTYGWKSVSMVGTLNL